MDFFTNQFATTSDAEGKKYFTSSETSLVVSILSVGTFFGAVSSSFVADKLGRKIGLIISTIIFAIGALLQVISTALPLFIAGRAVAGFGVGILSAIVPLYQSESAPKWIRGTIVGCYQWAITFGIFFAACANQGSMARNDTGSYRIPLSIQFLWALILGIGMIFLPDTPRYYIMRDNYDAAAKSLSRLRRLAVDHPTVQVELAEIKANHEYEQSLGKSTYAECFGRDNIGRLFTGCGIQALQQLAGVNFIFYFGTKFFQNSGINDAFTIALITNLINVVATIPGLWLVERTGRRQLLLWGAVLMCTFHIIVASVGITVDTGVSNQVLIAFICLFIAAFAASWGPVASVVCGESKLNSFSSPSMTITNLISVFPLKVRAKSLSMCIASNWLFNWTLAYSTPYLVDSGPGNANLGSSVFFIWGGFTFVAIFFVYFFIYETKGLSLEEVDELYHSVKAARHSPGWTPVANYRENLEHGTHQIKLKEAMGDHHEGL